MYVTSVLQDMATWYAVVVFIWFLALVSILLSCKEIYRNRRPINGLEVSQRGEKSKWGAKGNSITRIYGSLTSPRWIYKTEAFRKSGGICTTAGHSPPLGKSKKEKAILRSCGFAWFAYYKMDRWIRMACTVSYWGMQRQISWSGTR